MVVTTAKVVVGVALPSAVGVSPVAVGSRAIGDRACIGATGVGVVVVVVTMRVVMVVVGIGWAHSARTRPHCSGRWFVALAHGGSGS